MIISRFIFVVHVSFVGHISIPGLPLVKDSAWRGDENNGKEEREREKGRVRDTGKDGGSGKGKDK